MIEVASALATWLSQVSTSKRAIRIRPPAARMPVWISGGHERRYTLCYSCDIQRRLLGMSMGLRKTSVAIDEELLAAAQAALNTKTIKDTVEHALLEVLRAKARRDEVRALSSMDGMDLADEQAMRGAWRS